MKWLGTCLGILCCTAVFGQNVEAVAFDGLNRLRPSFLEQFITANIGAPADSAAAQADCFVLRQLPAVYHADVRWESRDGKWTQVYAVDEVFTLVPYGYIGQGGAETSRTIQLGAAEFNAFGRGVWLSVDYQYKELNSVSISGRVPYIGGRPWNIDFTAKHWNTVEPLYFGGIPVRYHYQNRLFQLGVEREFKFRTRVGTRISVFDERYTRYGESMLDFVPQMEYFEKALVQLYVRDQNIKWHYFYLHGAELIGRTTTVYNATDMDEQFLQGDVIAKFYRHDGGRWNSAYRVMLGLATNNRSPYAPYFIDSQANVRGAGDRISRGTAGVFVSAEWRWTAFDRDKWALQLVGYSDLGWLRAAGISTMNDEPEWYTGGGVRVHAKRFYNAVLRADYGVSLLNGLHGLTFGLGQFF